MKKHYLLFVLLFSGLLMSTSAFAVGTNIGNISPDSGLVYNGQIDWLSGDLNIGTNTTIDQLSFTVDQPFNYIIDLLSWENTADPNPMNQLNVDVNGDGEIAYFDTVIRLFNDDGSLDAADQIAENDDSLPGDGANDGSIFSADSYWQGFLNAGDYILVVGDWDLTIGEAINASMINTNSWGPLGGTEGLNDLLLSDHGDYQLSVSPVPEPATMLLVGSGLLSLLGFKRKSKTTNA